MSPGLPKARVSCPFALAGGAAQLNAGAGEASPALRSGGECIGAGADAATGAEGQLQELLMHGRSRRPPLEIFACLLQPAHFLKVISIVTFKSILSCCQDAAPAVALWLDPGLHCLALVSSYESYSRRTQSLWILKHCCWIKQYRCAQLKTAKESLKKTRTTPN